LKTDAELICGVQAGDQGALAELYERYLPSVWRYVGARCHGDLHLAEDLVSEVFLAAFDGLVKLDPPRSLYPWFLTIARNKLTDHWRRAQRTVKVMERQGAESVDFSDEPDPPGELDERETSRTLLAAMDELPDEQRLALEWKYLDELSVRQIAEHLGQSESAAASLLNRARNGLRGRLGVRFEDYGL
jgi:RNA polymerase sigma factor (sigma-70 family)